MTSGKKSATKDEEANEQCSTCDWKQLRKDIAKISRKLQRKGMNQAETLIFETVLLTGNSDSRVSDGR